jgi:hypothetical protein
VKEIQSKNPILTFTGVENLQNTRDLFGISANDIALSNRPNMENFVQV